MENHPFLRSLVAEGGSSGTGRLASTGSRRNETPERFESELSSRLREREVEGERVSERRETLDAARERREARAERSERRTRAQESAERTTSTQATDEPRESDAREVEAEAGASEAETPAETCGGPCGEAGSACESGEGRAEAKLAKAARAQVEQVLAQAQVESAPETETLGLQLGQGKGLEAPAQLAPKPNAALAGANEAVEAPQGELALEGDAAQAPEVAPEGVQPAAAEPQGNEANELVLNVEPKDSAARQDAGNTPLAPREVAARETTAPRPEVEAAKSAPRNESPVSAERAADMLRQIRLQLSPELRQATIQLEPRELGRISVKVTLRGGVANAELRVEKREALDALQKQIPELEAALERAGLGGGELTLQLGLEERSSRDDAPVFTPARRTTNVAAPAPLARALSARLPATSGIDTYA